MTQADIDRQITKVTAKIREAKQVGDTEYAAELQVTLNQLAAVELDKLARDFEAHRDCTRKLGPVAFERRAQRSMMIRRALSDAAR